MSVKRMINENLKYVSVHIERYRLMSDEDRIQELISSELEREKMWIQFSLLYDKLNKKVGRGYIRKLDKHLNFKFKNFIVPYGRIKERSKEIKEGMEELLSMDSDSLRLFVVMQ